jgi:hypothetical protein
LEQIHNPVSNTKAKNLAKLGESQMCKERLYELGSPKMRAQCEVRVEGQLEPTEFPEPSTPKELTGMRIEAITPYTQKKGPM